MTKIYKYPLEITDTQVVRLPAGAKILHCGMQYGVMCLWAMVDTEAVVVDRHIRIYGTGNPADDYNPQLFKYISTVPQGSLIWHVFEAKTI